MSKKTYEGTCEMTTSVLKSGCAVACKICPQELLVGKYSPGSNVIYMSFDSFVEILSKIPKSYRIDFSGYAEPFLNKECSKMIQYAHDSGYAVCCYTTLVGVTLDDIEVMSRIPFTRLHVHLPDKDGIMPIKVTNKYRQILKALIDKRLPYVGFMTMDGAGEVHDSLKDLVGRLTAFTPVSRANNLDNVKNVDRVNGKIRCKAMPKLNHNVILPNGNVQLCCNDYGLQHTIGNIIEESHESLFEGSEFLRIKNLMENDNLESNRDLLCRTCDQAESFE